MPPPRHPCKPLKNIAMHLIGKRSKYEGLKVDLGGGGGDEESNWAVMFKSRLCVIMKGTYMTSWNKSNYFYLGTLQTDQPTDRQTQTDRQTESLVEELCRHQEAPCRTGHQIRSTWCLASKVFFKCISFTRFLNEKTEWTFLVSLGMAFHSSRHDYWKSFYEFQFGGFSS